MNHRVKVIVPFPMDERGVANRRLQLKADVMRPGFEYDFVPIKNGPALGDSFYDAMLMEMFVFEAGLDAERLGYSAVCIDTVSDSALYALRSRLNIPVWGAGQIAFHTAAMLGQKFSLITMWDKWLHFYKKSLTQYGLWHCVASMRSIDTRPDVSELLTGKEDSVFAKLEAVARRCIEEDGADVIMLGSTTMHQSYDYLRERLPVPVVNPGLLMFKFCEMMLDLGWKPSKVAFPTPEFPRDEQIFSRLVAEKGR